MGLRKTKQSIIVKGWIELLYRLRTPKHIANEIALDPEDYAMVGSCLPMSEFETSGDIYDAFSELTEGRSGVPRALAEYDIINLVTTSPAQITSLILVSREKIGTPANAGFEHDGVFIEIDKHMQHGLIPLRKSMPSFAKR